MNAEQLKNKITDLIKSIKALPADDYIRHLVTKELNAEGIGNQHKPLTLADVLESDVELERKWLQNASQRYLKMYYVKQLNLKVTNLSYHVISQKNRQRGKVLVEFEKRGETRKIGYFIKTDSNGELFDDGPATDIRELFVYKAFQYIGIGAKCHFICSELSNSNALIATKDVTCSKKLWKSKSLLHFDKYSFHPQADQLLTLDIITHVFNLQELLADKTNIGCVQLGKQSRWIVLSVPPQKFPTQPNQNIFQTWSETPYSLMKITKKVVNEYLMAMLNLNLGYPRLSKPGCNRPSIENCLEKALQSVIKAVQKYFPGLKASLPELMEYQQIVLKNFQTLSNAFEASSWKSRGVYF